MSDRKLVYCSICKKRPVGRGEAKSSGYCQQCHQRYASAPPPPATWRRPEDRRR